jgi:quinoprotein dehydrogenase-associated probable ABC transporter substrate-binding protein
VLERLMGGSPLSPGRRLKLAGFVAALAVVSAAQPASAEELRVCADPNNLPFSDAQQSGFENKLAAFVAAELGKTVTYTWWAQRRGFIRNTLKAQQCDLIIGVPVGYDPVETTRPYYRSTYVFVSRRDRDLDIASLADERLRQLSIGVHLIGDDGSNTPPADALALRGITGNLKGYMVYGDYRQSSPPARLIEAVGHGDIDVAAAWGPLAGYSARSSPVPLRLTPIEDDGQFAPLKFRFAVAMGVRKGDHGLREQLDAVIDRKRPEIRELLASYGVPLVDDAQPGAAR